MFEEDLSFLFADFAVNCIFGSITALVIFDQPDNAFVSNMQVLTEYEMTFKTGDLPGLKHLSVVSINGTNYSVKDVRQINDGALSTAGLSYL